MSATTHATSGVTHTRGRTTTLLEPSFVDLIAAIERAGELSTRRRRHWACSLRQIAKWLDRPLEVIPARWQAVGAAIAQLHYARVEVTAKTLANHRSNVRAALRWFGEEQGVPQQRALVGRVGPFPGRPGQPVAAAALQFHAVLLGSRHRTVIGRRRTLRRLLALPRRDDRTGNQQYR
jgi:hypothetical protein